MFGSFFMLGTSLWDVVDTAGTFVTLWLWQQVRDVDTSVSAKQNNFFVQISLLNKNDTQFTHDKALKT